MTCVRRPPSAIVIDMNITPATFPAGTRVASTPNGDDKGTVTGWLRDSIGVRWDNGGTSTFPAHFGGLKLADEEVEEDKLDEAEEATPKPLPLPRRTVKRVITFTAIDAFDTTGRRFQVVAGVEATVLDRQPTAGEDMLLVKAQGLIGLISADDTEPIELDR